MTASVAIRSNGMFLAPVIGLEILQTFFANLKHRLDRSFLALVQGISIIMLLLVPFVGHNLFTYFNICEWSSFKSRMC
jgi:Gpi18-like mannosyltransferase